ncbi:outer membrane lipoprotein carrier protein LolA [Hylemonella gracilis]|uniref:Outer membrane lipoprotein carrier protein LolA n=1 Tax=Hylemonella gracilis TaxID=80880 RepID=A0A4P6UKX4_9BURK|nr:outer membrane lipoprotein carrier protein LolA [Hylemonella gracilis]QBK05256.1 outer membrane lipoprotein carrier protein LolA [Hylemonella gracilis]
MKKSHEQPPVTRPGLVRRAWLARALGLLALGLGGLPPARATEPDTPLLAQLRQRLQTAPVLRGRFEQHKRIQGFKNPLVSRGDFLVARERGILWHTRTPFESTLIVTRDRLQSLQADGSVGTQLDAREEPGLRAINALLFALMAADLDRLAERFHIEGQAGGASDWRLVLTPRDAALAQWLARVELQGERYVNSVTLTEARGDESVIRFSAQSTAAQLSPAESARFE